MVGDELEAVHQFVSPGEIFGRRSQDVTLGLVAPSVTRYSSTALRRNSSL
ncbi:hypothetical protein I547_3467 [Mycobacterium kansasii 824]|uniref:Uncharacterized protein n=1 Tax=Mycobacterium kansasii TaxID=1768 RepID=A0A1V3XME3_MYCKA|nr:hypothetical protein I547_3467 [Mycobacterium kansasii 824]KEP39778.1 hypothetical protein MKSMC1_51280 [Mycobacterium kansasii]OOK80302.1 hypothetical protein BZL29_2666 [Mycobacterium kansasii]